MTAKTLIASLLEHFQRARADADQDFAGADERWEDYFDGRASMAAECVRLMQTLQVVEANNRS